MKTPVIIDACRTPIGRASAERGAYRDVRGDDLAAQVIRALVDRSKIDPAAIEDVLVGCTQQRDEQGFNVGRMASLLAGVSHAAAGATINRLCGSSLQALAQASHSIIAGAEDVHVVAGVEHMHHLPMDAGADAINPKLFRTTSKGALMMGLTAEFLAQAYGIDREAQDAFALASHQKAAAATDAGEFRAEIIPTWGRNDAGERFLWREDQCIRRETSLQSLGELAPAFMPQVGTVTAGNSSPLNDGAAALLVMSGQRADELGLAPLARIRATAVAGVDPAVMGTGPVAAVPKALARAGMELKNIDLVELNEAFAAQSLACIQLLELDPQRVNVRGGAIAIGHPLGASGARIVTTLLHAMIARNAATGLATMCVGMGQGVAVVLERV